MKIKVTLVILVIAAAAALFFSKSLRKQATNYVKPHVVSVVGTPEEKAMSVLEEMYKAMEQENLEKTLEYIAPDEREAAKAKLQKTFADYDLTYKLSNLKAVPGQGNKINIEADIEIKSSGNKKFRDRKESGTAHMIYEKDKAAASFVSFKVKKITYL